MSYPLIVFASIFLVMVIGLVYFLRGALFSITTVAAQHAKIYAVSYVKGSCLVLISMGSTFKETWQPVTLAQAQTFQWWDYVIKFEAPLLAGLSVLAAFLDSSKNKADEVAAKVDPIIPAKPPVI